MSLSNVREYETMIITKPDLPESDLSKMVEKWENIIARNQGQIVIKEPWGVRKLANPINKFSRGNYYVYDVAVKEEDMKELHRVLRLDENVLRSMIVKLSNNVNVDERRAEIKRLKEEAAQREAEAQRDRVKSETMSARRGEEGTEDEDDRDSRDRG